jgi:hypothetical protein
MLNAEKEHVIQILNSSGDFSRTTLIFRTLWNDGVQENTFAHSLGRKLRKRYFA